MCKNFFKFNLKNRCALNNTVFLTVLLYVIYSFTFILPHNLHCFINTNEQNLCQNFYTNSFSNNELSNSGQNSENENKENEDQDQDQDLDDCPICNLSYFNGLYACKLSIQPINLQESTEKPFYENQTGFSSFTFFKFFLRSPPAYLS